MSEKLNLQAFRDLITPIIPSTEICTVESVDLDTLTITAVPLDEDEAEYLDVRLSVDSEGSTYIIPSVGSLVLVSEIEKESGSAFVSQHSVPEKMVMMGGDFGGLIKIYDLVGELNKVNTALNIIIQAINASPVVPTDGGASFKAGLVSAVNTIVLPTYSDIENKNITHGGS